ncbi:MAG: hypothetical protein ACI9NT_002436, partial [Bacteroidia bacterium]
MNILQTRINTRGEEFADNRSHMQKQVDDLREVVAGICLGGD